MAIIIPGKTATIKSDLAEKQLFYAFQLLHLAELNVAYNPQKKDNIQSSFNDNTFTFNGNFTLPCTQELINGQPLIVATNYLEPTYPFNAGSPPGTFKSTNLPAYLVEVITYCQILENDLNVNLSGKNYINASFNSDRNVFSGSITMPYETTMDETTGNKSISISPYLDHSATS